MPARRILWLQLFMHLYWVGSATAGALLGSLIPDSVTGLDFALTALFTVLALDAIRDRRDDLPTPILAVPCAALAARLCPPRPDAPGRLRPVHRRACCPQRSPPAKEAAPVPDTPVPASPRSPSPPPSPGPCGPCPSPPSHRCAPARPSSYLSTACPPASW